MPNGPAWSAKPHTTISTVPASARFVRRHLSDAEPNTRFVTEFSEHSNRTTDAEAEFLQQAEKALAELMDPN
ncbi:hypothetical protein [Kitasatospora sp. NPDC005856]|uniref:hypothetical protein n=1 Tax=Kitasatospora sp. NPDC005856 TaxID=3154566 RepID=UPI0033CAE3C1